MPACVLITEVYLILCAEEGFLPSQRPVFAQQKVMVIHWLSLPNGPTIPINMTIFLLISTSANTVLRREMNQAFSDASDALILPWQKLQ